MFRLEKDQVSRLCQAGNQAPSGGNSQPWKVAIAGNSLILSVDPTRSGSMLDAGCLASIFALGMFTENLLVCADHLRLKYRLEFLNPKDLTNPFLKINFLGQLRSKAVYEDLFPFIEKRVTNRKLDNGQLISEKEITALREAAKPSCLLGAVSRNTEKATVATILGKADRIRTLNDTLFKQMFSELRWDEKEVKKTRDGVDLKTMEMPMGMEKVFKLLKNVPGARKIAPRKTLEEMATPLLLSSSHLCCLSVKGTLNAKAVFEAGRAMEKIWLLATRMGLALHPWTVITFLIIRVTYFEGQGLSAGESKEISALDKQLRKIFGHSRTETPLFVFRLFKASPPTAFSLRRDLDVFVEF